MSKAVQKHHPHWGLVEVLETDTKAGTSRVRRKNGCEEVVTTEWLTEPDPETTTDK